MSETGVDPGVLADFNSTYTLFLHFYKVKFGGKTPDVLSHLLVRGAATERHA